MGKRKDLSNFDKGQIVMARRLGQSISKTAAFVGCSQSAVADTHQKQSKEGKAVNQQQGHGQDSLMRMGSKGWPMWYNPTNELL